MSIEINQPLSIDKTDIIRIKLSNGKDIKISGYYSEFYDKLLQLKPNERIELLQLSVNEIEIYLADKKLNDRQKAIELIHQWWYSRETSEPLELDYPYPELKGYTLNQNRKLLKSKKVVDHSLVEATISFFDSNDWYVNDIGF